jgi:hypothetical protein
LVYVAEGVDEQGMVTDCPGPRHSIGLKGGAAEAAAPVGCGVPVAPGDLGEARSGAP